MNEELNSDYDASQVLGFDKEDFRGMLVTLGVINQRGFSIQKLCEALVGYNINFVSRRYRIPLSGNKLFETNSVRFGFYGSERCEVDESIQPNASADSLYSFLQARDGPPDRLEGDDRRNPSNPCNPSMTLDSDDDEPDSDNIDDGQLGQRAAIGKQQSFVNDPSNGKMYLSCLKAIHENRVFKNKSGNNLINSAYIGNYLQVP